MTREPWPPRPHDAANQEKLADGDDEIRSMAEALCRVVENAIVCDGQSGGW